MAKHDLYYINEEHSSGYIIYMYGCLFCERIFHVDSRYMKGLDILENNTECSGNDIFTIKIL